jgi:hypothetical protein
MTPRMNTAMLTLDNEFRWCDPVHLSLVPKTAPLRVVYVRNPYRVSDRWIRSSIRRRSSVAWVAANRTTSNAELHNERPSVPGNASLSDQRSPTAAFAGSRPRGRDAETLVLGEKAIPESSPTPCGAMLPRPDVGKMPSSAR